MRTGSKAALEPARQAFLLVQLAEERRLVPMAEVREIVAMAQLSAGEAAGRYRGLLNLRGELIPVFELCGPEAVLHPSRCILVCGRAEAAIGAIVDDVLGVRELPAERIARHELAAGHAVTCVELEGEVLRVLEPREAARA